MMETFTHHDAPRGVAARIFGAKLVLLAASGMMSAMP